MRNGEQRELSVSVYFDWPMSRQVLSSYGNERTTSYSAVAIYNLAGVDDRRTSFNYTHFYTIAQSAGRLQWLV